MTYQFRTPPAFFRAQSRSCAVLAACIVSACSASTTAPVVPASAPGAFANSPAEAELSVADVANFWTAYDAGKSSASFQSGYLDKASAGLNDFIRSREVTAQSLSSMVQAAPRYFAAARTASAQLVSGAISATIRTNYGKMQALYPSTVFPPVTFLVGRFSTAGTTANNRILIGTEFYGAEANTPIDELGTFQRDNVHPSSWLPLVVAHEHVHIVQARAGTPLGTGTLLQRSMAEGVADFVGEMVSGGNMNAAIYAWALPREHALWVEFQGVMNGTDVSRWLYNQGSSTATPDRPGDLGYFMGYRIAQAYYNKAADKTAAVRAIIEMRDASTFLTASGYNP